MNRQEWNALTKEQKGLVIDKLGGYYREHNSLCSYGKLTPYVQELISKIEVDTQ